MCGIFAYIGSRQVLELLIAALKRMEYRGYDSAGAGIHTAKGKPLAIVKKAGKVANLEQACQSKSGLEGTCGIAHTRWATHGKPTDANAHPHATQDRTIAVVHNGVIENHRALKEQLTNKGYVFTSETDTELLSHLVQDLHLQMPTASWSQVVASMLQLVEGAYGIAFMFSDDPDLLIGARHGSPLIIGVGDGEYMLASDASAVVEHTKDVIYLREGELVELRRSGYKVMDIGTLANKMRCEGSPRGAGEIDNPIVRIEMSLEQIEKGGYPHFMLKEIMDQPNALRAAMRGRLTQSEERWQVKLGGLEKVPEDSADGLSPLQRMAATQRIIIAACGTSWHSALIGKAAIERFAHIPVEVEYASEFRYRRPIMYPDDVFLVISQSGETADTLEAIRIAKQHKALTIGIVNAVGSSIARATDAGLYLHAGPEIGVASTKAFTGQVIAILILALQLGVQRKLMAPAVIDSYCGALNAVPDLIQEWLEPLDKQMKSMAKYFRLASNALFCGSGIMFPVALEGALKLKEISYIHAEGFCAAEIQHGPLTLIRNFIPIVCVAFRSDPAYEMMQSAIDHFKSKDAAVIVVTNEGNDDFKRVASFVIQCPNTKPEFEPLLAAVPLQLLSYYIADMRGCSIDQPRNLAKSVTVE